MALILVALFWIVVIGLGVALALNLGAILSGLVAFVAFLVAAFFHYAEYIGYAILALLAMGFFTRLQQVWEEKRDKRPNT